MGNLAYICSRVEDKKRDYAQYDFSNVQDDALKTFFDLAQEFESLEDLYLVCVAVPKTHFGLDTNLYVSDRRRQVLVLVCTSIGGYLGSPVKQPPAAIRQPKEEFIENESLFTPIFGKMVIAEAENTEEKQELLGVLEIIPGSDLTASEQLFFQKYANRIGYSLYNRILSQRNVE
ncbi:MAG: sensor histidine kinase, partial [Syntrophobacteria bacterium]